MYIFISLFYITQGDSVQICQGDKTWSGTQAVCAGKTFLSCFLVIFNN